MRISRCKSSGYFAGITSLDAAQANRRIPDDDALQFAIAENRALLTQNRRDFLNPHRSGDGRHFGIVLCTADPDFAGQSRRIDDAISRNREGLAGVVIRVNRPLTDGACYCFGVSTIGRPPDCPLKSTYSRSQSIN